jgi:DNA-directed RNA polymerase specialized sigma subunit
MVMTEKKDTFKIKRETHQVSQEVKDNLKKFNAVKSQIIKAFGDEELTVPQIAEKIKMSHTETFYYVMTLLKFNVLQTVRMDDNDEFYFYKIKK